MASVLLRGNPVNTNGELPKTGTKAPDFQLTATNLSIVSLKDYAGTKLILNIFPSIDTPTCATSTRSFNAKASGLENTKVLCISRDLPFAFTRFCGAEGLDNVICLSDFNTGNFGKDYGLEFVDGAFIGLHSRAIVVIDENGVIRYTEQVPNTSDEPNYEAALAAL
jgi:thioredoxin-dependent peroxiredoxin